jgi:holo-[acyl-carrier protein] synthase
MTTPEILGSGNIVAHGVDIVDLVAFSRLIGLLQGTMLWDRYYTPGEWEAAGSGRHVEKLASRFAIKEAILKALGTGWGSGIAFTDVEVITLLTGAPTVALHRKPLTLATSFGITKWLVSASHTRTFAIASAIALNGSSATNQLS